MGKKFCYYIRKWYKMLVGNSVNHLPQGVGQQFVPGIIKGYFNDLTQKVIKQPEFLEPGVIPYVVDSDGRQVYFPVAVFQYGLGAYDMYLTTNNEIYLIKFWDTIDWCINHQNYNGSWDNFSMFSQGLPPYSAMCQGEGASLLLRAYILSNDLLYFDKAKSAIDFMLKSVNDGGTTSYYNDQVVLLECTSSPAILNGWIFALYGLYDFSIVSHHKTYKHILKASVDSLLLSLSEFDNGYWSKYDLGKTIASPFYHSLHISQMDALYHTFGNQEFEYYKRLFEMYQYKKLNFFKAFFRKVVQKIFSI